jgi:predicted  nucleic acid-binding Zn-ribbon protein
MSELEQCQEKLAHGQAEIERVNEILDDLETKKVEIEHQILILKSELSKRLAAKLLGNANEEPDALRNKIEQLNVELEEMPLLKAGLEHHQLNIKKDLSAAGPKIEKLSAVGRFDKIKKELFEQSENE